MHSTVSISLVFALVLGLGNAINTCYQCSGKGSACPEVASATSSFAVVTCSSVLKTVCAKYSIDLPNGEAYTYRDCEPAYIGGTPGNNTDFCTFIRANYEPLVKEGLLAGSRCSVCDTVNCNT